MDSFRVWKPLPPLKSPPAVGSARMQRTVIPSPRRFCSASPDSRLTSHTWPWDCALPWGPGLPFFLVLDMCARQGLCDFGQVTILP